MLSADLFGVPIWDPQGPAPTTDGQASASPDDAVTGSVNAVAPDPTNPDILYVGGTNGGIWKTTNATSDTPNWTPLTDQYPTLSIGDLAFSPLDATNNTLFAGTGGFDNGSFNGPAQGILRTTDGGATWQQFGQTTFANDRIRSIVPTSIGTSLADQVVLVAAIDGNGGVYRSTNGGQNFSIVSGTSGSTDGLDNNADGTIDEANELNLPTGAASYLVGDPGNPNRFYTAIATKGIFRSDNGGANWVQVNNGLSPAEIGSNNIELAVSAAAGNPVYAGFVSGGALVNVFRSGDQGGNWTVLGTAPAIHPGTQGFNNFSIAADPGDANIVFVGGDVQASPPFVGNLFRGDASSGNWDDITDTLGTLLTAPHADSRDMAFDANGDLVESDDGGVFRFSEGFIFDTWSSLNRNLQVAEFYSATYDHVQNVIFGGTQDTGSPRQTGLDNLTWDEVNQGDGGTSGVGYGSFLGSDFSVEYTMGNNFGTFERHFSAAPLTILDGQLGLNGLDATDSGFTGFTTFPYAVNRFSGAQLVIGGNSLYESTDFGDNLTNITPAGVNGVSAVAYGGSAGGTANPGVIYAGVGGNLFLRTTSGGAFTQLTNYTGGSPQDIVLDPDDWHGVYVTDGTSVFHSTDAGNTWTTINAAGLTALTSRVNAIEVFSPTTTPGDEVLLAGGTSGVFRTRNPSAGATALWSEFGAALPNTPVADIQYDATDDVLIASDYGRGVWKVADASTFLPVAGVLQVDGDTDFPGEDDIIKLVRNPNVTNILDVYLNNLVTPILSVPITSIEQINVNGLGGKDTLIVDSTNGLINVVSGIRYDGGAGADGLQLLQTGGPTRTSDTYSVGPAAGSGVSTIVGGGTAGTQVVSFENLSPVLDTVLAASLTVNATAADNAISYSVGSLATNGLVAIDAQEPIEFANKSALTINAGAGQDTISLNNPNTPTGLTGITVNGGDPTSGDTLTVTGVSGAVSVNTVTRTITGATGAGGAVSIGYSGIESLNLPSGIGDLTLTTTGADDTVVVTPGLDPGGANSGTVQSSGAVPQISFVNSGALTLHLGAGNDALVVNGSSAADTVAVSGSAVGITGRRAVNYDGVEALTVNGNAGSDTFNVTPATAVAMFIDGGDPAGQLPGDLLNITAGGASVTFNAGPGADEGSFVVGANQPVSFDHIESIGITGNGSAVINGTNGPDAITVIARDASTDGIQDFTVSVNGGPALQFTDMPTLTINAGSGSDVVTLEAPAPNNAAWNVNVTVNGGTPAADTDQLIVQTPGAGAESVVYIPNAPDGGTLDLTSITSLVTINGIDVLTYDGQGDNDSLTVKGTGGSDVIVHNPGTTNQAGRFQVNSLLALSYQNLGAGGSLTVDGNGTPLGGTDTLEYNGTAANDTFTIDGSGAVGAAGQVTLNSRLLVNTTGVANLTLRGFDGDDTFSLVPEISASVYQTIKVEGGGQASATGDQVILVGTASDDTITVSGQTVIMGTRTINASGIEDIRLNALGGTDLIIYNGVSGTPENIKVSSSGVVGGGQISVPGVTLVDFTGVERIDVNGNTTPTATEDTLTFAGTNAVDTFQINLTAAGTDAAPILKLQNSTGTTTLLTLRNYTNFDTLRTLGLDGADTFNVTTAASGPSRNLFVDGGLPTAKKKSTDNLNIFYNSPRPSIIHSTATQNPGAGIVDLNYGTARFVVQYDDIEQVVIRKS